MATQLNIKDPETVALARTMAARSGRTVTATVRDALDRANSEQEATVAALLAELRAINPDPRALLLPEWRDRSAVEIANSIYNEDGSFAE